MTDEEREELLANAYEQWLSQQDDKYVLNRLVGEVGVHELEEHEVKQLVFMITERNLTGKDDPRFQDVRDNL